jgi:hypothetical protein
MRIMLRDVRQSFMCYWKPEPFPNSTDPTPYFSGTYLLPADHPQLPELKKICLELCVEKWGKTKGPAIYKAIQMTGKIFLRDGNAKPDYDGFPGNWFISARSKVMPSYFDGQKQPITEAQGVLYSGCYVNVSLEMFAYTKGNNGLGARQRGVQFLRKGDAFGGGGPPADESEFDEIDNPEEAGEVDPLMG